MPRKSMRAFTSGMRRASIMSSESIFTMGSGDMMEALRMPDVKARMDFLGMELNLQPMKEFDAFVEDEMKRWKVVLDKAGVLAK